MGVVPPGLTVPRHRARPCGAKREAIRERATRQDAGRGTPRAIACSPAAQARAARREKLLLRSVAGVLALWLILLLAGIWMRRMPWVVLPGLVLLNIATFFVYWKDKVAAEQESIRIREEVLHGLALLGGWPAAWLAQQVLRHKTIKRSFQAMFWFTVLVNVVALAVWVLWPVFNPEPLPPPPEPWQ
jgi:uncharacterized membrane protein YsdA (DUF1294 family)